MIVEPERRRDHVAEGGGGSESIVKIISSEDGNLSIMSLNNTLDKQSSKFVILLTRSPANRHPVMSSQVADLSPLQ